MSEALYPLLLGSAWNSLGEPVRRLHAGAPGPHRGTFAVKRGTGVLARFLGWLLRLPAAGTQVPVTLELCASPSGEIWRRRFADRALVSTQCARAATLAERFGLIECRFRLEARDGALRFVQTGAALRLGPLCLPLSSWAWPRVAGLASPHAGRVHIEVTISAPVAGLLLDYRGEIAVGGV